MFGLRVISGFMGRDSSLAWVIRQRSRWWGGEEEVGGAVIRVDSLAGMKTVFHSFPRNTFFVVYTWRIRGNFLKKFNTERRRDSDFRDSLLFEHTCCWNFNNYSILLRISTSRDNNCNVNCALISAKWSTRRLLKVSRNNFQISWQRLDNTLAKFPTFNVQTLLDSHRGWFSTITVSAFHVASRLIDKDYLL